MRLFIAEKPSLGQAIAEQLSGKISREKTHITVGSDVVTWCFGHILIQAMPENYNLEWKQWSTMHLPLVPPEWKLLPKEDCRAQLTAIKNLIKQADIIVHAGDPDREGQLLVDEVLHYLGNKKTVKRILINDYNGDKVKQALATLKDNTEPQFKGWYESGLARARFDWLFGLNLTRAYTLAARRVGYDGVLSVGRVQTPTLALVVSRDLAIENFISIPFYTVTAQVNHPNGEFQATWQPKSEQPGLDEANRLIDINIANKLSESLSGKNGQIIQYEKVPKKEVAPNLFSLSGLIKAANNRFGYSAQSVLDTCQSLYETHKLTTYPRTDCEYVSLAQHTEAPEILATIAKNRNDLAALISKADPTIKSAVFNDTKVTAHHAIVPTHRVVNISALSQMEQNIYEMIVRCYVAQFFPPYQYLQTIIKTEINGEIFFTKGKTPTASGWHEVYTKPEEEEKLKEETQEVEQNLPVMQTGDTVACRHCHVNHRKTTPPSRFTEGTLQDAMKDIHRFVTDPEVKKRLREGQGIGTEATRPGIIEELKKRNFIAAERKGSKKIMSTENGRALISALPLPAKDPALTAICEQALELVHKGTLNGADFLARNMNLISRLVKEAETTQLNISSITQVACQKCNTGKLRRMKGKNGFFWSCSNYRSETEKCVVTYPDKAGKPDFNFCTSKEKVKKRRKKSV